MSMVGREPFLRPTGTCRPLCTTLLVADVSAYGPAGHGAELAS